MTYQKVIESPIGKLLLVEEEGLLAHILFEEEISNQSLHLAPNETLLIKEAAMQLQEYFSGQRREFNLPLRVPQPRFQAQVHRQLQKISYGQTLSYSELGNRSGSLHAGRAAGSACRQNSLPIVVPCHRVISKSGKMTGYAGGVTRKVWLLEFEAKNSNIDAR